ncbi:MAG: UvrD-helicase domain-containing protein [Bacteroidales bacterium]|nr:UvrD-helicase domain-containing protein [Bacteroidales bacterium]
MNEGKIIKYTASAGSGKTHTLTGEYLIRLFNNPAGYRRILAVTFTNKAAAEMKGRILDELAAIAAGNETDLHRKIREELNLDGRKTAATAKSLLSSILGDYSRFSVGTIDSFFQKVFRAFAREIGLQSNFSIYLDFGVILRDTVDDLIHKLNENEELRRWLVRYAASQFEEGKQIDLAGSVYNLSSTVFSEQFKLIPQHLKEKLSDLGNVEKFVSGMEEMTAQFRSNLRSMARRGVEIIERNGVDDSMLRGGKNGVGRYLRIIASGEIKEPYQVIISAVADGKWFGSGKQAAEVETALAQGLGGILSDMVSHFENRYIDYKTAEVVLRNIYMAAILADVLKLLREKTNNENSFILADTGDLLMQVIGNDQTPFIFEKTGNEYDVFMIDEFQDTSMIQYRNFKPLIENSLAQGSDSLVVGDIKQSIYRWRNGDWSILGRTLEEDFTAERIDSRVLATNWRSLPEIVRFNNSLFSVLPALLDSETGAGSDNTIASSVTPEFRFSDVYRDVLQKVPEGKEGGYVRIAFVRSDDDGKAKEKILGELPGIIRKCQDDGYSASDIGLLVRTRSEGTELLDYLTTYRETLSQEESVRYNFSMLSGESLLVGNSPAVRFIVSTLVRIIDSSNQLNRTEMIRYYQMAKQPAGHDQLGLNLSDIDSLEEALYPDGYREFLGRAGARPLFSLSEEIIDFFGLNKGEPEMACLNFFQDQVLEFMNRKGSGLKAFTEWWLDQGKDKSVILSGEQEAIRIMTIHKAKGLQFRIVIIPFISWKFDQKPGNLLWVTPESKPFDDAGAFPVAYSSALGTTLFGDSYRRERAAAYLDNLNLLYVAFTRAEERLYGFAYSRGKGEAGSVLLNGLSSENPGDKHTLCLNSFLNTETDVFETGVQLSCKTVKKSENLITAGYPVIEGGSRLKLRLYGRDLFHEDEQKTISKIYYGTVLHDILSRITTKSDVEAAVNYAVTQGYILETMAADTISMVQKMVSGPDVAKWFDGKSEIMAEREILNGTGDIRRPDRIVISQGRVSVIDYKFGEERSEHIRQIEDYSQLLKGMGYTVEEACLWYVEKNKIIRV